MSLEECLAIFPIREQVLRYMLDDLHSVLKLALVSQSCRRSLELFDPIQANTNNVWKRLAEEHMYIPAYQTLRCYIVPKLLLIPSYFAVSADRHMNY